MVPAMFRSCGESAAAGLGVLLKAAEDPELRGKLGLNEASQVVLFGGEGATDPQIYAEIVGCSAGEVFERQREIEDARPGSRRT
jgi:diaminopropionate ammonia-lyase